MSTRTKLIISAVIIAALVYLFFALDIPYRPVPVGMDLPVSVAPTSTDDMAFVSSPRPDTTGAAPAISSPAHISGYARGPWYFEASFPVSIVAADGTVLGSGHATAQSDWMTDEYVPWQATVSFARGSSTRGYIRLERDNPSGDPARSAHLDVPVSFATSSSSR